MRMAFIDDAQHVEQAKLRGNEYPTREARGGEFRIEARSPASAAPKVTRIDLALPVQAPSSSPRTAADQRWGRADD